MVMIILGNQDIKGRGEEAQVQSQNHHVTIIRIKIFNRIQSEIWKPLQLLFLLLILRTKFFWSTLF
jgi:hypothetical protein